MADCHVNARRMYINVITMNNEDEEYGEEMKNTVEELKEEETQRKKYYQSKKQIDDARVSGTCQRLRIKRDIIRKKKKRTQNQ